MDHSTRTDLRYLLDILDNADRSGPGRNVIAANQGINNGLTSVAAVLAEQTVYAICRKLRAEAARFESNHADDSDKDAGLAATMLERMANVLRAGVSPHGGT